MTKLDILSQRVAFSDNRNVIDYANRIASVFGTAVQMAEEGHPEDLELLVILIQNFAGERGKKLQQARIAVETETSQVIARAKG